MKYRMLRKGEMIVKGDEVVFAGSSNIGKKVGPTIGLRVGNIGAMVTRKIYFRRPLKPKPRRKGL